MPLNANIPLMTAQGVQDQGNIINNAFGTYYNAQQNKRQNALLDMQQKQQIVDNQRKNALFDMQMKQAGQQTEQFNFEMDAAQGAQMYRMFQGLGQLSPEMRAAQIEFMKPALMQRGFDDDDWDMLATDEGIKQGMAVMSRYAPTQQNDYFAPVAALDKNGNPVYVQGSKSGGLNKIEGFTPMKTTEQEASQIRINEAQEKAKIDVEKDINKLTGTAKEERILSVIDTGIAAADVLPTYDRMLELIEAVDTGGVQSGLQRAKQLFGWGAADIGELDALFKEAVLSNLRKMGANPTEGERQFLLESSGSITQSPAVLKRLISRRRDQSKNAVEKGKKWASERGDTEALELMGMQSQPAEMSEDDAALQWAQSNPNDPRAQQILKMVGGQ